MSARLRLAPIVLLALLPSACTLVAGLDGLTGSDGSAAGDDALETDAPSHESGDSDGDASGVDAETGGPAKDTGVMDAQGEETGSRDGMVNDVLTDPVPPPMEGETGSVAYFQTVSADSPQAYWRLDEPTGSATAHDITGHGYDGVYVGGVTLAQPGAIANDADPSAKFDGSTGYVDVSSAFPFAAMADFTLEAWLDPVVDTTDYHCWISHNDASGGPSEGYLAFTDPSGPYYAFQRVDQGTKVTATNNTIVTAAWTHVVITYAHGVGSTIYVNGQASPTTTNDVSLGAITAHFVIGAENGGSTSWWTGQIDEVAVYSYALSAARILTHYKVGTGQ